jgi:acetylglutamate kinase
MRLNKNMHDLILKAETLVEALPYIKQWYGSIVVIKYGGSTRSGNQELESTLRDIVLLKYVGLKPIIVHGGGKDISDFLTRLGIVSKFIDGLRITDKKTMEIVEMVLSGKINKEIVLVLNKLGASAIGLSGKDGSLLLAEKVSKRKSRDLGWVGKVSSVNSEILEKLLQEKFIPVVAPIGMSKTGDTYNINADEVAGHIAAALKAQKLIFLTDVPGIQKRIKQQPTLISTIRLNELKMMIKNKIITGGMIPKVESCVYALQSGVQKTHIIDGRVSHALLLEMFTPDGIGTQIIH